jgi:hypothetical protein
VQCKLALVGPRIDRETLEALEQLVADAKAGRIVGLAYVALHAGTDYSGDVVGRAKAHPIFTLGVCRALADTVTLNLRETK